MKWVLLLRAVNLGPHNKIAMKDLTALLEDLGHTEVTTYLNSGNATFCSPKRSANVIANEIEKALASQLTLHVRACVRTQEQLARTLERLPDLPGYVAITVLFDPPSPAALKAFLAADWAPETVRGDDQALYIGFVDAARTKLTIGKIEKALGVSGTARTPATLRKLLG